MRPTIAGAAVSGPGAAAGRDVPVVIFDGWCPLCVGSVRFVLRKDRRALYRYAALDSEAVHELLETCSADPADLATVRDGSTVALAHGGRVYTKSDAALRIASGLPFPWKLLGAFRLVPRFVRDRVYLAVASRRHAVWGKLAACHVPTETEADRFL
jgi:predicted DCC family thiol-disulfide oxidoreductase YuxK